MKYVCPGCDRLVEVSAFWIDAGALVLRCTRCGEESRAEPAESPARTAALAAASLAMPAPRSVPPIGPNVVPLRPGASEGVRLASEAAASGDPFRVPEGRCPKCVAARPENALSCPACGLTYELFEPESVKPSPGLSERWVALLAGWDDSALHTQMLQNAVMRGELATVGRLYRIRLAFFPDDPIAMFGRDEVVRLATAHGAATVPSERRDDGGSDRLKLGAAVVLVLLSIGAVLALARQLFATAQ